MPPQVLASTIHGLGELDAGMENVLGPNADRLFQLPANRETSATHVASRSHALKPAPATGQGIFEAVDKVLLPDFLAIKNMKERQIAFFEFLRPLVQEENRRLLEDRRRILDLQAWHRHKEPFRPHDRVWLEGVAERYRVQATLEDDPTGFFAQLLEGVDIIPVSLALAQAADESGLGSSRLAKEGNNLFGQTCAARGCRRGRMLRFESVAESVRYYIENLNVNNAYQDMRSLRANLRAKGRTITGEALTPGLSRYSEQGSGYVRLIQSKIRMYDLTRLDEAEFLP
ncbi:MAG: glucosaminidase domain-containing protein [Magnetococcales bacterium]|nr:glucosaminidase domain-containing protein [Magnetococcales bacterium]